MGTRARILEVMHSPPRPFQVKGVRFIERRNGRGLIGDDMGLGKTYQTICYIKLHPEIERVLIVCPKTIKWKWQTELMVHAGLESTVVDGRTPYRVKGRIWIINWDVLKYWVNHFTTQQVPMLVVPDECQRMKNIEAERSIALCQIARHAPHVLGLSGTPIENGPIEFFPILKLLDRKVFRSQIEYAFRFCAPKKGYRNIDWDFRGASNLPELHKLIKPYMIRRTKEEVLPELPPKQRTIIPLDINMTEYNRARQNFLEWLMEKKGRDAVKRARGAEAMVRLGELRRLAARGKISQIVEWIKDFHNNTGEKLVTFVIHKRVIKKLIRKIPGAVVITGSTSQKARQDAITKFQTDPNCIDFFGNIRAAGEGTDLVAASTVAFTELDWVGARHDQAEDRVNRIGQTAKHINAYYFIAKGTVEEKMYKNINRKRSVVGEILDGEYTSVQTQIIEGLLAEARKAKSNGRQQ